MDNEKVAELAAVWIIKRSFVQFGVTRHGLIEVVRLTSERECLCSRQYDVLFLITDQQYRLLETSGYNRS